ncbi:MAG: flavodoxin domain-containing protein [Pseudomonadota bacterium]
MLRTEDSDALVLTESGERIFPQGDRILLVYASHTGTAQAIATDVVKDNEHVCDCIAMGTLTPATLEQYGRQLFIAATHGEGEPPTECAEVFAAIKAAQLNLQQVDFAVLALGSRGYTKFCQFGRDLYFTLVEAGAVPRMQTVEVHNNNAAAIAHWRELVSKTFGLRTDLDADWETATVMEPVSGESGDGVVTLYIKSLELETTKSCLIKEPGRRQDVVEFQVVKNPGSPFTQLLLEGNSKLVKALKNSTFGDKWLVRTR